MSLKDYLRILPEVSDALSAGRPIVALESTVITHGLPYPDNLEVTNETLAMVKSRGVVPAVILIDNGYINVGLSDSEVLELSYGVSSGKVCNKASIADIGPLLAGGATGSTTVAATMLCAQLAGIKVFATGGIGGVHRGVVEDFDISNDLQALRDISVAVVASGAKSILDIPKTLEVLETFGVCIVGYGTDRFPCFYSSSSSHQLLHHTDDIQDLAKIVRIQLETGHGVLVANPIPAESEIPRELVEVWVDMAVSEAAEAGIKGKAVTPFLLKRLLELSDGKSVAANRALLINNAKVAAEIACA